MTLISRSSTTNTDFTRPSVFCNHASLVDWIVLIPPKWCKLCEPDLRASQDKAITSPNLLISPSLNKPPGCAPLAPGGLSSGRKRRYTDSMCGDPREEM